MFTQYGLSGSAILDISRNISVRINREKMSDTMVRLCFFPQISNEKVQENLKQRFAKHPDYPVAQCLWGLFSEKTAGAICAVSNIPKGRRAGEINEKEKQQLQEVLTSYFIMVTGTRGWNEAEFTAGGVNTTEIDSETLASKNAKGIYFAGEMLDVDGPVGGFNLSWAWASGWLAGQII
jgi:predicted Rossmann fold flavoprotein